LQEILSSKEIKRGTNWKVCGWLRPCGNLRVCPRWSISTA